MTSFADHAEAYLAFRRSLGAKLEDAGRLLPRFAAHLDSMGAETITVRDALSWAQEPAAEPPTTVWARRLSVVRGFARYMTAVDPRTEVPPPGLMVWPRRRRLPFIYTPEEVEALRDQARSTLGPPLRAATFDTLIGLLAVSGMRVSEVLHFTSADIDWSEGVLSVRASKFGRSRHLPLHPTTTDALAKYAWQRNRCLPSATAKSFFVSSAGTPLIYSTVRRIFSRLVDGSGIAVGSPVRPHIHDFRHAFAVRTLIDWHSDGGDVAARMPWLSTYLGHREPRYTYWYLTAVPELLALAAGRLEAAQEGRP
jgi:integrase/recombinase XerD